VLVYRVELSDFRNYHRAEVELDGGTTAVIGRNGQGKTNLVEAISYLATLESFRGVPLDALVRVGADTAILRARLRHDDGREILIEAEINRTGRNRVLVNKQRLQRARDLLGVLRATVFSPDDLEMVYGAPAARRKVMDDGLLALSVQHHTVRTEVDRIVRQRNTLLRQAAGRLTSDIEETLDVWDEKFTESGTALGEARAGLVARMAPFVQETYERLAGRATPIDLRYEPEWRRTGLGPALAAARRDDVRRGVSTVGPHRDDLWLDINGMPARSHASRGECRTLALAVVMGLHTLVTETVGAPPLLILDDVLSELDPERCTALLDGVPRGQVIITSATDLPPAAKADRTMIIEAGNLVPETEGSAMNAGGADRE